MLTLLSLLSLSITKFTCLPIFFLELSFVRENIYDGRKCGGNGNHQQQKDSNSSMCVKLMSVYEIEIFFHKSIVMKGSCFQRR